MKNWFKKSGNIISISILIMGLASFSIGSYVMHKDSKEIASKNHQLAEKNLQVSNLNKKVDAIKKADNSKIKKLDNTNKKLGKELSKKNAQLQNIEKQLASAKKKVSGLSSRDYQHTYETIHVMATAYTSNCLGCSGTTSTGINVSDTTHINNNRIVAVDTNIIPLHSILKITTPRNGTFYAQAEDQGGGIVGNRIDVLMSNQQEAINFGVQDATIEVLRKGA